MTNTTETTTMMGILYEHDGRDHLVFTDCEMIRVYSKTLNKTYLKVRTFEGQEIVIEPMSIKKMKMVQI